MNIDPMGRGKERRIVVCAVAAALFLLLSWVGREFYDAATQQHSGYSYQPAGKPGIRIDGATKAPTPHYKPSCKNPYEREDADLCAQWAAVEQVSETNRLSSLSLKLSIFALLFTVIGTGFLIWTFWETRETARRELRAYVSVKEKSVMLYPETRKIEADVLIVNTGQTPAFNTCWAGNIAITTAEELEPGLRHPDFGKHPEGRPVFNTIGKDQDVTAGFKSSETFTEADFREAISGKRANLFIFGTVWYEDAFGERRFTNFCQMAESLPEPNSKPKPGEKAGLFVMTHFHNDSD